MKKTTLIILLIVLVLAVGCASQPAVDTDDYSGVKIRIAQQYGMQYAPVYVMQNLELLEELLPGISIEWSNFGGGSAMNEALISNQLDVAFMGIPPVLIAIDKGVDYRIACGISVPPAELIVHSNSGIDTIADIQPQHKIAVPGIGSIQHMMLSIAAKEMLGNVNAFDNCLVAMANPDAYIALTSGTDVVGHFASMPYIDLEINDGMKSILTAEEIGGGASIVCVTTAVFEKNQEVYAALLEGLNIAIELINKGDERAMQIIAETEKITIESAERYVNWPGTLYTADLYKVDELAEFMFESGYLINKYMGFESVTWKGAKKGQ